MAEDFQALQRRFAAHLRDPDQHPAPAGLESRRLQIYRDLFFNNLVSLLAGTFPVLRSLHDEAQWRNLVRSWYRDHRARTPLFPELGGEFVEWLQETGHPAPDQPPRPDWFAELAHYEWMEVVASNAQARIDDVEHNPDGDLLDGLPVLSPLVWPLVYRYAVHRIRPDARPSQVPNQPTCLIIVRDRTDRVGFLEANPWTLSLLQRLRNRNDSSGRDALRAIAADSSLDETRVIEAGRTLLERLRARDIILGTRP